MNYFSGFQKLSFLKIEFSRATTEWTGFGESAARLAFVVGLSSIIRGQLSYIKLYLLPDRSKNGKRKSSVHRHQLEPKFDERFTFAPLKLADFDQRTLWLSVLHKDRLGRNELLGELLLPLTQIRQQLLSSDLCQSTGAKWYQLVCEPQPLETADSNSSLSFSKQAHKWQQQNSPLLKQDLLAGNHKSSDHSPAPKLEELRLRATCLASAAASANQAPVPTGMNVSLRQLAVPPAGTNLASITGQLFVALKFVLDEPSKGTGARSNSEGELHVMIKEAHNISGFVPALGPDQEQFSLPTGPLPNPFCKCYLLNSNGQRLARQRTPHLKRTVHPRWDHKCVFSSLRLASLANQAIEIQMYNRDSILVSKEYLGGIRLCSCSSQPHQAPPAPVTSQSLTDSAPADSASIASSDQSVGDGNSLRRSLGFRDSSSNKSLTVDTLCSERESRLWSQMLARPDIWVYGELTLRYLHPLIPKSS